MQVTINNKKYTVPALAFKDMMHMENMGFSVLDIIQNQKIFSIAAAFTGVVANCDREEAERLVEQHVLGGGNLTEIYKSFAKALNESDFFKALLEDAAEKGAGK